MTISRLCGFKSRLRHHQILRGLFGGLFCYLPTLVKRDVVHVEAIAHEEFPNLARLVEITSDAVVVCQPDGCVLHVNKQFLSLVSGMRENVIGIDIKDMLFSDTFERSEDHRLPFGVDGSENTLMLKLSDGSFIPVSVRSLMMTPPKFTGLSHRPPRVLVVLRNLEEQYAKDRRAKRLFSELQAANKRLSGTLSVIMSTVGSEDLSALLDTVLNKLADTLDADGTTIYFSESGGFKLRGASKGLAGEYLPDFIPYGAGIGTYVTREAHACRFSIAPTTEPRGPFSAVFYDIDARVSTPIRVQDTPPFKTVIAAPVFFGTQVLGIIELGWKRHTTPRVSEVRVLEVICDYLSIELVGLVGSMRSQRVAELTRSLNQMRDAMFSLEDRPRESRGQIVSELKRMLSCRICPVVFDATLKSYVIDFEGGSRVALPCSVDDAFFSSKAPASRLSAPADVLSPGAGATQPDLKNARLVRVDRTTKMGDWLYAHGLPGQGVFIDMGRGAVLDAMSPEHDIADGEDSPQAGGATAGDPSSAAPSSTSLASVELPDASVRMFLLLRDGTQEPIDDMEYDYLLRLVHDLELIETGVRSKKEEQRIAQTLQAGMRSQLGRVPGITSDSLYSSATKQALVGGDFYTLIRLPGDRAVMILGDVSGKGVEAASMSALVKTALTAYAWEGRSPVGLARSLNSMLMGFSRVETFATMFIAKIDLRAGTAVYCSAGHPPTMIARVPHEGRNIAAEVEMLSVQSGVVGAFENMVYETGSFTFEKGDIMFMYTDGAIEARNAQGDFFGEQRLRDLLLTQSLQGIEGLCDNVLLSLDEFTGSVLDDDIAMVALRFDTGRSDAL